MSHPDPTRDYDERELGKKPVRFNASRHSKPHPNSYAAQVAATKTTMDSEGHWVQFGLPVHKVDKAGKKCTICGKKM